MKLPKAMTAKKVDKKNPPVEFEPLQTKWYGWRPSLPDQRDFRFELRRSAAKLPRKFSNAAKLKKLWNQQALGSCVANSVGQLCWMVDRTRVFEPSRLFLYYNGRQLENTVSYDSGLTIRNGVKAAAKWGYCSEVDWPYQIGKFTTKPAPKLFTKALGERVIEYGRVEQTSGALRGWLAAGYMVVFGFSVYDSFESDVVANTGKVPLPSPGEELLGGHSILLSDYDDSTKIFKCPNWWGANWGDKGWCHMSYDYILNPDLASDFWVIRTTN